MVAMSTLPFGRPQRSTAGKRTRDAAFVDPSTVSKDLFSQRVGKKAKVAISGPKTVGRCGSAPPLGWTPPQNSGQTVFPDVTKTTMADAWGDPNKKGIRLVYPNLVMNGGNYQGLLIADNAITSSSDAQLHQHLDAVKESMMIKQDTRQITEATGEAATALAMVKRFPGAKMKWGMHVHSGAGIDQIWVDPSAQAYYIVEAKGVGAGLTTGKMGPPPEICDQMSLGWVLDNLARMARQPGPEYEIAREVLDAMGLEETTNKNGGAFYANYGGASKNYYACSFDPNGKSADMFGVVVNAIWNASGLSYVVTDIFNYGNDLPYSTAIKS